MLALPLYKKRALYVSSMKAIVIADLHIGIEYEFSIRGANIPSQTEVLLKRCEEICKEKSAEKLIILGDVKHMIVQVKNTREYEIAIKKEKKEVKFFLDKLKEVIELLLIRGNHDGGLNPHKNLKVYGSRGLLLDEIGFVHGHAWPSKEVMKGRLLVMGHVHPVVRLRDKLGYSISKSCWIRASLKKDVFLERYRDANAGMEVIIMPAFNPLCGGMAVNTEGIMGPMKKLIDLENANAYLLDGTNLGKISYLQF
ncbi:MAG: metallophosphoesterase [Candidatus Thermoplasmatota archaeon]|nr:metallophosphoesterase [Candidatus Thermoplasmatota archaeon]